MAENGSDGHYYLTLDDADENSVRELVWVDGPNYFIRDGGTWLPVDPDDDNAPVWGQIVDVTADAADAFDKAETENPGDITLDLFEEYEILEEDPA